MFSIFEFVSNFRLFKWSNKVDNHRERGGAVEAYWAHNPGVGGSKPLPATFFIKLIVTFNF